MTPYNPDLHHRRSIRLRDYDYSGAGAYFVTLCTHERLCRFGVCENGTVTLSQEGRTVLDQWEGLPGHFSGLELDALIIMPNHLHGVLVLEGGAGKASLGDIIGAFKSHSARLINQAAKSTGTPVWQRNYHEHVIRNAADLERVRGYITNNPGQWAMDKENPSNAASTADAATS